MRNEPVEIIEYKGYSIKIYHDDSAESTREWDNIGTMVCWHRRYNLGDKHTFSDPEEFLEWAKTQKGILILRLYLYDHSGISMSTGSFIGKAQHAEWDSGQVGFIYVTKEKIIEEYGKGKKAIAKAEKYLEGEVEIYDQYLRGNVYGFNVEHENGYTDSCWGFYGSDFEKNGLLNDHARPSIDCEIGERWKKRVAQLKEFIRHHVPLEKRKEKLIEI